MTTLRDVLGLVAFEDIKTCLNGREDNFSSQGTQRGCLHETTQRF